MGKCIILDTETSGLPPKGEACEIAYFEVPETILQLTKQEEVSLIYSPSRTKLEVELSNFLHLIKMRSRPSWPCLTLGPPAIHRLQAG